MFYGSNPPFLKGDFIVPLFGKEGLGEIFSALRHAPNEPCYLRGLDGKLQKNRGSGPIVYIFFITSSTTSDISGMED
jgi:hypothetical protein